MPIYDIFETKEIEPEPGETLEITKGRFFSSLTTRLLFFVLLLGDIVWAAYSFAMISIGGPLHLLTGCKVPFLQRFCKNRWIGFKRSGICGLSLLIALFSPALGIMIACTYFLMYDKTGIQEVVPKSLQDQFQEFMK